MLPVRRGICVRRLFGPQARLRLYRETLVTITTHFACIGTLKMLSHSYQLSDPSPGPFRLSIEDCSTTVNESSKVAGEWCREKLSRGKKGCSKDMEVENSLGRLPRQRLDRE